MNVPGHEQLLRPLPAGLRANIAELYRIFTDGGYECYLVGGLIRDLVLGRSGGDVDIATNARPETVQKLFRRSIPTGLQHGTVTVLIEGHPFEVTTYRADGEYSDGRRPDSVAFSDRLVDDLARRDFTINALAFEPGRGELIDEFDGLADIAARRIRTIGDPHRRFFEDGLRPVRACRFAATLGFDPVPETRAALADPEIHERTRGVAVERFTDELWKGMQAPRPERMLRLLEATGLLYLFPVQEYAPHPGDESLDRLGDLGPCASAFRMAWWWRSAGVAPAKIESLGKALKFSGKQTRDIRGYFEFISFQEARSDAGVAEPFAARRFLSGIKSGFREGAVEFIQGAPPLTDERFARSDLIEVLERDPLVAGDLALNGRDLQGLGLQGKAIGQAIAHLLEAVWTDPACNTVERLQELVRQ